MSLLRIFFRTHVLDAPAKSVITRATIKQFVSEVLAELPVPDHTQHGGEANCWAACLSLAREGFLNRVGEEYRRTDKPAPPRLFNFAPCQVRPLVDKILRELKEHGFVVEAPSEASSEWGSNRITRELNRFVHMGGATPSIPEEAGRVTDAFECLVEDRYRGYLLTLAPGVRIADGWRDICEWITKKFGLPDDVDDDSPLQNHLTVRCMAIVESLCRAGFLVPTFPSEPEREFVRTNKSAPKDKLQDDASSISPPRTLGSDLRAGTSG